MPEPPGSAGDVSLKVAAVLLHCKGYTQHQIAAQLGTSQPTVQRLLDQARRDEWYVDLLPVPNHEAAGFSKQEIELAEDRHLKFVPLRNELRIRAGTAGINFSLHVQPFARAEQFVPAAAEALKKLLQSRTAKQTIGVTWGPSVQRVIKELADQSGASIPGRSSRQVIPLCGEPRYISSLQMNRFSSTRLAADLEAALVGSIPADLPSLSGVPVYVHSGHTGQERKGILAFIEEERGYQRIFGSSRGSSGATVQEPLINSVHTMLTSVGVCPKTPRETGGEKLGIFLEERLMREQHRQWTAERMQELILGDIGGVIIPRSGLTPSEVNELQPLIDGWIGLKEDHIRRCAREAGTPDKFGTDSKAGKRGKQRAPGVIVIATRPERAELLCEGVQRGLINRLIVNGPVAAAMANHLGVDGD